MPKRQPQQQQQQQQQRACWNSFIVICGSSSSSSAAMSFYSSQNLSRQGPLRLLWTAAHLERQLKRQQVRCQVLLWFRVGVCEYVWL